MCESARTRQVGVRGDYRLLVCDACDVGFSDPMRAADAAWYAASPLYLHAKALHLRLAWHHERFLEVAGAGRGRRLLDVGCGTGAFLARAAARGWGVTGVDFDADNVRIARARHGLADVHALSLAAFRDQRPRALFDAVTLFEVVEHVEDPVTFLRGAAALLDGGGRLALSTPNRHRRLDALRDGDEPPNHLTRWSATALAAAVDRAGLAVETLDVKRVGLDDVAGYARARLGLGLARRALARGRAAGDARLVRRARRLMRAKDALLQAAALPVWPLARLRRWQGGGLLCIARRRP